MAAISRKTMREFRLNPGDFPIEQQKDFINCNKILTPEHSPEKNFSMTLEKFNIKQEK